MAQNAVLNHVISAAWSCASAIARVMAHGADAGARVISVGNLQAGGAGKTPIVAEIARQAAERGLNVCVLTRGYRSKWERGGGVLRPRDLVGNLVGDLGGDPAPDAALCGDEAALLHDLAPRAWIGVGSDRVSQLERVKKEGKIDLVILDDGFQNHQLRKDLEIVAVTSSSRCDRPFRDFDFALRAANLVVFTKRAARRALPGNAPSIELGFELPRAPSGAPVLLVSGVADAGEVRRSAEAAGYLIADEETYPDHASYPEAEIDRLLARAKSAGHRIALTGKDWVKWRGHVSQNDVWILEPKLVFDPESRKIWNQVIWKS